MPSVFIPDPDAAEQVMAIAKPGARMVAELIGPAIVAQVPVNHGVMARSFKPTVEDTDEGAAVVLHSPFWHWLEYGTATSPIYRPVELGVRSLGLRYEAL